MIVLFLSQKVSLLPRSNVFLAGEVNFVQAMYRSLERSPQDTRDGFNLYSAHASSPWPGHLGATTFSLFGLHPSSLSKSAGFVSLAGEALSFLYLMLPYFYDSSMFIYRFIRISWKKVCWKGSMAAEMSSPASYLVYYIVWRVIKQIITKIRLSIKDTNN